jgi:hypothetical protein
VRPFYFVLGLFRIIIDKKLCFHISPY